MRPLRACAEITSHFAVGPQARWQGVSDEHTVAYVRSEQRSQRACGPQPKGARRRAGICCVVAPRRWHRIACVAPPCICPPGARAKMGSYFCAGPKQRLLSSLLLSPDECTLFTSHPFETVSSAQQNRIHPTSLENTESF